MIAKIMGSNAQRIFKEPRMTKRTVLVCLEMVATSDFQYQTSTVPVCPGVVAN